MLDGKEITCKIPLDYSRRHRGEEIHILKNYPYMEIKRQKRDILESEPKMQR